MILRDFDVCKPLTLPAGPLEVEVGCGKGRFLTGRAAAHPEITFLGIERMLGRVQAFDAKTQMRHLTNAHVLRLEALYTFWYMLSAHGIDCVYVFFPDPWPKKHHHSHRLFGPLFLKALWKRLKIGGRLEFATDHAEYFHTVELCFAGGEAEDGTRFVSQTDRFRRVAPMVRERDAWTEFETRFRAQGLPIYAAAWEAIDAPDYELEPLKVPPEDEPRPGLKRRIGNTYQVLD